MGKHGIQFNAAYALDAAALQRMPQVTIRPTLEYDAKRHTLKGPLKTTTVLACAAGVPANSPVQLVLRAVDGYTVNISLAGLPTPTTCWWPPTSTANPWPWAAWARSGLCTTPMCCPPFRAKPSKNSFALCPWKSRYHIDVQKA